MLAVYHPSEKGLNINWQITTLGVWDFNIGTLCGAQVEVSTDLAKTLDW